MNPGILCLSWAAVFGATLAACGDEAALRFWKEGASDILICTAGKDGLKIDQRIRGGLQSAELPAKLHDAGIHPSAKGRVLLFFYPQAKIVTESAHSQSVCYGACLAIVGYEGKAWVLSGTEKTPVDLGKNSPLMRLLSEPDK